MKKIFTLVIAVSTGLSLMAQAQTNKILLDKNQQLKITGSIKGNITQEMMGQSMETVMDVNTDKNITVKEVGQKDYQLDGITTRIKMNMSMMGQDMNFDSDKKEDMAGQMKEAGKDINVVKPLILTAEGKCRPAVKASPEKTADAGMNDMMQQLMGGGAEEVITESYFMIIPEGKKIGDSWMDSVMNTGSKTIWNYKWESVAENIAVIKAIAKSTISSTVNTQGMDMTLNVVNDIDEVRKVNTTNGVVVNKNSTAKISGTIDVMGQSVPVNGNVTTIINAQ
jgi:hypothetical protein